MNYEDKKDYYYLNETKTIGTPKDITKYLSKGRLICRFDKKLIRELLKNTKLKHTYVGVYINKKTKMPCMHIGGKVLAGIVIDEYGIDDNKEGLKR
jgi:hypothetical protein